MDNKQALEDALEIGLINALSPSKSAIDKVTRIAKSIGSIHKLTDTDMEIAALAYELINNGFEVIVITDDYELQNLLLYMGVGFKPLRTRGIVELRVFKAQCLICGYIPGRPDEARCPLCGGDIKRIRV